MPCFRGTRYTRGFALRHADDTPMDITSWEFRGMVRDNRDDPIALLTLTTANEGFLIINGMGGRLQFSISPVQSLTLPIGRMLMDVERTDTADGPIWLFEATFQVKKPITRDTP